MNSVGKLIGSTTSPFVRKVRIMLAEKSIEYDWFVDSPWVEGNCISSHNPLGKVPVMVLPDTTVLYDSRVITAWIESIAPSPALVEPKWRMEIMRMEALGDGICDAAATAFLESKRVPEQQSQQWIALQQSKISAAVTSLAAMTTRGHTHLCGDYSLADIAVCTALAYLDLRYEGYDWRKEYPALESYATPILARPAFRATAPVL